MTAISSTLARNKLYSLIDEVAKTSKPIVITGKRANAVMISRSGLERHTGNIVPQLNKGNE